MGLYTAKPPARGGFVQQSGIRLLCGSLRFGILTAEALNTTCRVHQFLLAGKEWVAIRTDFEVDVAFMGRASGKTVSARANYPDFLIVGMNTLLWHDSKNLSCNLFILKGFGTVRNSTCPLRPCNPGSKRSSGRWGWI